MLEAPDEWTYVAFGSNERSSLPSGIDSCVRCTYKRGLAAI